MDRPNRYDPYAGASSASIGLPPQMGIDDPEDLQRILCIFKTLETIIKPIKTQADIMRNRQYYLATHFHRYKYISGVAKIPKPYPRGGSAYYLRPYGYWVRDPDYDHPPPDMSAVPMPFEIRDGLDRAVATDNIRKLFKELDDILSKAKRPEPEENRETAMNRRPDTPEGTMHDLAQGTHQNTQQNTLQDAPNEGVWDYEKHLAQLLKGTKM